MTIDFNKEIKWIDFDTNIPITCNAIEYIELSLQYAEKLYDEILLPYLEDCGDKKQNAMKVIPIFPIFFNIYCHYYKMYNINIQS